MTLVGSAEIECQPRHAASSRVIPRHGHGGRGFFPEARSAGNFEAWHKPDDARVSSRICEWLRLLSLGVPAVDCTGAPRQ
jgi:hypothetical protein